MALFEIRGFDFRTKDFRQEFFEQSFKSIFGHLQFRKLISE